MDTKAKRTWAARALAASMLLALAIPTTVGATSNGAVAVTGIQRAYGTCGELSDGYEMTGDLVGCWWITNFWPQTVDGKHNLRATGTELFVGWIGDRYGSFETTYQYTAKFDGDWNDFIELHGRCHHPIVAGTGTGDLVGITGEISFKDVLDGPDSPNYPYWGALRIAGEQISLGTGTTTKTTTTRSGTSSSSGLTC